MKRFVKIPTVLENNQHSDLGIEKPERTPTETFIDLNKVVAFTETIPDEGDGRYAILIYLDGIQPFYSPLSVKEFKEILDNNLKGEVIFLK